MADSYNTPGVPAPEDSARSMRDATRAIPAPTQDQPGENKYDDVIPSVRSPQVQNPQMLD